MSKHTFYLLYTLTTLSVIHLANCDVKSTKLSYNYCDYKNLKKIKLSGALHDLVCNYIQERKCKLCMNEIHFDSSCLKNLINEIGDVKCVRILSLPYMKQRLLMNKPAYFTVVNGVRFFIYSEDEDRHKKDIPMEVPPYSEDTCQAGYWFIVDKIDNLATNTLNMDALDIMSVPPKNEPVFIYPDTNIGK